MVQGSIIVLLVLLAVVIVFIVKSVTIVPQQHAWVIERLGRFHATLSPGLKIVIPFIDRIAYKHSLKEIPLDTPSQYSLLWATIWVEMTAPRPSKRATSRPRWENRPHSRARKKPA